METRSKIQDLGRRCDVYEVDLANADKVGMIISNIAKEHSFDILVNVAGIQRRSAAASFPQGDFNEVMNVNLSATFRLCRDTGKYWLENNIHGSIINIASVASFQAGVGMAAYTASKGAVVQLTKALSNEWAIHGIRVNAIAPGYVKV